MIAPRKCIFAPAIFMLAAMICSFALPAAAVRPEDRVFVQQGNMPILLTAPHGGNQAIPGIERRVGNAYVNPNSPRFAAGRDSGTFELAQRIARKIHAANGRNVYTVLAQFQRYQIDANRAAHFAYESPLAAPYYDYYHASIRRFVDEIRRQYPNAMLLDIHGQHTHPQALERGTVNGLTVEHLLKRAGPRAVTGADGLFGQFEARGIAVFPSNALSVYGKAENGGHNGGHTVATYGSHRAEGIDAFQLEFGTALRLTETLEDVAERAAKAILRFYDVHVAR